MSIVTCFPAFLRSKDSPGEMSGGVERTPYLTPCDDVQSGCDCLVSHLPGELAPLWGHQQNHHRCWSHKVGIVETCAVKCVDCAGRKINAHMYRSLCLPHMNPRSTPDGRDLYHSMIYIQDTGRYLHALHDSVITRRACVRSSYFNRIRRARTLRKSLTHHDGLSFDPLGNMIRWPPSVGLAFYINSTRNQIFSVPSKSVSVPPFTSILIYGYFFIASSLLHHVRVFLTANPRFSLPHSSPVPYCPTSTSVRLSSSTC